MVPEAVEAPEAADGLAACSAVNQVPAAVKTRAVRVASRRMVCILMGSWGIGGKYGGLIRLASAIRDKAVPEAGTTHLAP
jgi:hypothetical protein